jgi:hypothetical protein
VLEDEGLPPPGLSGLQHGFHHDRHIVARPRSPSSLPGVSGLRS